MPCAGNAHRTAYFRCGACRHRGPRKRRAEAPLRGPAGRGDPPAAVEQPPRAAMAQQTQEPVTFEDVAVYLSRTEWDVLTAEQRQLYRSVMCDNYELLASLGYPGPKPDILHRLEHEEEPWVCAPQSPRRWDGPSGPSPAGHDGFWSFPEEPPGWRPSAGGCRVPEEEEEGTRSPCSGGRRVPWRLRLSRLLRRCPGGRSAAPAEPVGSRAAAPAGSPGQALPAGDAEEEEGAAGSRALPPGLAPEPHRSEAATPLPGLEELVETVVQDHGYHATSQGWLCPWPLREHSYSQHRLGGDSVLGDHRYCHGQQARHGDGRSQAAPPAAPRLQRRKTPGQHILRRPRCLRCSQHLASTVLDHQYYLGSPRATILPTKATDSLAEAPRRAPCPPAEPAAAAAPHQPQGGSRGATSEVLCAPAEVTGDEALSGAQRERLTRRPSSGRHREGLGRTSAGDGDAPLQTVQQGPGALCRSLELGGSGCHKDVSLITVGINS